MPIDRITAAQFEAQLRTAITDRTETHDTAYGPIKDIVIAAPAQVLEGQNDRIRQVSLLLSLVNSDEFTDDDLDDFVFNEGLTRIEGSRATGVLVFSMPTEPTINAVIPRGFPVASQPDASSGTAITFVTTEERLIPAATASTYLNLLTNRYELEVPVEALTEGSTGLIGAGRITRQLQPLGLFSAVTNRAATQGGRDRETNEELIERYLLAILGRELSTPTGVEKYARDNFPDVEDVLTVYGGNALLTRAAEEAGAVDAYIVGATAIAQTDNLTFLGVGQLHVLSVAPLVQVSSVTRVSPAATYVEGTDYEVVFDGGGNAGSPRAADGIRFLVTSPTPPTPGQVITVEYTYNNLIRSLQAGFELDDTLVHGRDLLFKQAEQVDIILEASLRVSAGFSVTTVQDLVEAALLDFINALELGDDVELSDLQGVVRRISGVDNFIITRLVDDDTESGTVDLPIADNQYARLAAINLTITII